jgi:hypothetical protein
MAEFIEAVSICDNRGDEPTPLDKLGVLRQAQDDKLGRPRFTFFASVFIRFWARQGHRLLRMTKKRASSLRLARCVDHYVGSGEGAFMFIELPLW